MNQGKSKPRFKIIQFMNELLELGVAGFRIDAAKHMWPSDLDAIFSRLNNLSTEAFPINSKPFIFQEVIDLGGEGIKKCVTQSIHGHIGCAISKLFDFLTILCDKQMKIEISRSITFWFIIADLIVHKTVLCKQKNNQRIFYFVTSFVISFWNSVVLM